MTTPPRTPGKYGRKPRDTTRWAPTLEHYLTAELPAAPAVVDRASKVSQWPMYLNDQLGDCVVEGTEVVAADVQRAYRVPYNGPVVDIATESGKQLTVTCNHAVLTSRGFVRASHLKEGDDVLGSNRPEAVARRVGHDLQHTPARIEDVFEAYRRVRTAVSTEGSVRRPIHFHGDEEFFESKVDVVDTDCLLENSDVASSGHPESQLGLVLAGGAAETLNGSRAAHAHSLAGALSTASLVGRRSASESQFGCHPAVAGKSGLGHRPYLHATSQQPSAHDLGTDSELPGEMLSALPGVVATDRVTHVGHRNFRGHVYDLSTRSHWYIANGILTHNCTCATVGHEIEAWTAYASAEVTLAQDDILALYEAVGGYVPGDPSTDNGCEIQDVLAYWQRTGVGGHKIAAYAALGDCTNLALMKECLQTFGTVYLGINCPQSAETQFSAGEVWTVVPGSPNAGGHAIPLQRWDNAALGDLEVVTWGSLQRMTMAFAAEYVEEAWVPVSADWLTASGDTVTGFNLAQLEADLAAV
jgi:hypothetical protein